MAIKVYTEHRCDRCDKVVIENASNYLYPLAGWASITVTVRHEGTGWTNNTHLISGEICPECTDQIHGYYTRFHKSEG